MSALLSFSIFLSLSLLLFFLLFTPYSCTLCSDLHVVLAQFLEVLVPLERFVQPNQVG